MNITTRDLIMNKTKSRTKLKEYKNNHIYIVISVGLQNSQSGDYIQENKKYKKK